MLCKELLFFAFLYDSNITGLFWQVTTVQLRGIDMNVGNSKAFEEKKSHQCINCFLMYYLLHMFVFFMYTVRRGRDNCYYNCHKAQVVVDTDTEVNLWKVICMFCSQFYEPEALLSDPADGRIFIELLGKQITMSLQGFTSLLP